MVYEGGERYVGQFRAGVKHGLGELYFKNNDKFVGEWVNDHVCGTGKLLYADGNLYDGQWLDDMVKVPVLSSGLCCVLYSSFTSET